MDLGLRALLVAWQEPESRRVFPVARLRALPSGGYELAYVRAVDDARARGFAGLPGYPDIGLSYVSSKLPELFERRAARSRPPSQSAEPHHDLADGEQRFDAAPVILTVPIADGTQARLEVFAPPLPAVASRGGRSEKYWGVLSVRGVGRVPGSDAAVESLSVGDRLVLRAEPDNAYNPHALRILREDGKLVGYVPDYLANELAAAGGAANDLEIEVCRKQRSNFPPAPPLYQVLCRYTCSAELGRSLFRSGAYAPIGAADGAATALR